jgi:hypothetical protein
VGLWIGMDEAGIGPNIGPLVVAAVVWETPGDPQNLDFWKTFRTVVARDPKATSPRLVIADSKAVFQPARGVGPLERTVLSAWSWDGSVPLSLGELLAGSTTRILVSENAEAPWHQDHTVPLPHACTADEISASAARWRESGDKHDVRLRAIFARVVHPPEFNSLLERFNNKADAVASVHQSVAKAAWALVGVKPTLFVCDKHGGRNYYAGFLSDLTDGSWINTVAEGAEASVYHCGETEFRFEPRAERYGPVALASMVAKYLRELHMLQFNAYWRGLLPELRPTQGYPEDARRFLNDIAPILPRLNIPTAVLWRIR